MLVLEVERCDYDNDIKEGGRRGSDLLMDLLLLLLFLPALIGLAGHHGDVGQIATAQITAHVTIGLGITGKGRFADRHRRRRRRRVAWEHLEHRASGIQQQVAATGALTSRYPIAGQVEQSRMDVLAATGRRGPIRRRTLAVEHCAIRRRPHALLVNLALLKTRKFISTKKFEIYISGKYTERSLKNYFIMRNIQMEIRNKYCIFYN